MIQNGIERVKKVRIDFKYCFILTTSFIFEHIIEWNEKKSGANGGLLDTDTL